MVARHKAEQPFSLAHQLLLGELPHHNLEFYLRLPQHLTLHIQGKLFNTFDYTIKKALPILGNIMPIL